MYQCTKYCQCLAVPAAQNPEILEVQQYSTVLNPEILGVWHYPQYRISKYCDYSQYSAVPQALILPVYEAPEVCSLGTTWYFTLLAGAGSICASMIRVLIYVPYSSTAVPT